MGFSTFHRSRLFACKGPLRAGAGKPKNDAGRCRAVAGQWVIMVAPGLWEPPVPQNQSHIPQVPAGPACDHTCSELSKNLLVTSPGRLYRGLLMALKPPLFSPRLLSGSSLNGSIQFTVGTHRQELVVCHLPLCGPASKGLLLLSLP